MRNLSSIIIAAVLAAALAGCMGTSGRTGSDSDANGSATNRPGLRGQPIDPFKPSGDW